MKVFCLGGAGRICRESIYDLVAHSEFEQITIGDYNLNEALEVKGWLNDSRIEVIQVDVRNVPETASAMRGCDVVIDGTQITLNGYSTECIARAGCHGVNLNGFGAEKQWDSLFKAVGKSCIPGFGMTPGVTQMMAMRAAEKLDKVDEVYVSHGAFRPIAFSPSITETTIYEYHPELPTRLVYEKGKMIQVPPFSRPKKIPLPDPYGETVQFIIPHSETVTLAQALKHKGVDLIEVRGTWPAQNMTLIKGLYEYGILSNPTVKLNGAEAGLMSLIGDYLQNCEPGKSTALYGYALHVEVTGSRAGKKKRAVFTHTHPASDGSIPDWAGLRAYTRNVGIPLAIAAEYLAKGRVEKHGVLIPEDAFIPEQIFEELEKRSITIHEQWDDFK
jgi:saccharopine dehydrogenase-like NADP-dependent oxidoreductase